MPFSLNDVHVIPLSSQGSLLRVQNASPTPEDSDDEEVIANHKGVTVHVNKHRDNGSVPFEVVPITAIVFTFIWLIVKAIMAPFSNRNRHAPAAPSGGLSEEEVAILHKLQRTLSQMESRVEALETILIDQSRTEKHYGSKL